jgi:hypothetical protein
MRVGINGILWYTRYGGQPVFTGFDKKDGAALFDTKESAIERAKMLVQWGDDPAARIMVHRKRVPLWLAHLVRGTFLQRLAYREHNEKSKRTA